MKFIKKHKYKLLSFAMSLISVFTLFLGISKTYAYETNQFTYTLNTPSLYANPYNGTMTINNDNSIVLNSYVTSSSLPFRIKFNLNSDNELYYDNGGYLLINYLFEESSDGITYHTRFLSNNNSSNTGTYIAITFNDNTLNTRNNLLNITNANYNGNYCTSALFTNPSVLNATHTLINDLIIAPSTLCYTNGYPIYVRLTIFNIDFVSKNDIGLSQYYETYYGQIESNYNQLLQDFDTLENNYNTLQSNYDDLENNYLDLQRDYNELDDMYSDLRDSYTWLQRDYNDLNSSFQTLQQQFNTLQNNYNTLNTNYVSLQSQFDTLNNTYQDLQTTYNNLLSQYNLLQSSYNELQSYNLGIWSNIPYYCVNNSIGHYGSINSAEMDNGLLFPREYFVSNELIVDSVFNFTKIYSLYNYNAYSFTISLEDGVGGENDYNNNVVSNTNWNYYLPTNSFKLVVDTNLSLGGNNGIWLYCGKLGGAHTRIWLIHIDSNVLSSNNNVIDSNTIKSIYPDFDFEFYNIIYNISVVFEKNNADDVFTIKSFSTDYNLGYSNGYNQGYSSGYNGGASNTSYDYELRLQDLQSNINTLNSTIADYRTQLTNSQLTINALNEQISSFSNDYGINNMVWTIASTPFESFKQIWNVELFGVNIAGAITGFLTSIIVLYIIKRFFL